MFPWPCAIESTTFNIKNLLDNVKCKHDLPGLNLVKKCMSGPLIPCLTYQWSLSAIITCSLAYYHVEFHFCTEKQRAALETSPSMD